MLYKVGKEDPTTRRTSVKVDIHNHQKLGGMITCHALIELNDFYILERRGNGKQLALGRHGQVAIGNLATNPSLGTKIQIISGVGKHSRARDGKTSGHFRGEQSAELSILLQIACIKAGQIPSCLLHIGCAIGIKITFTTCIIHS